ncbi:TetR/AcrR family transcriptional regulator [Haliangium sp.]|uniref:TetR/AcrR family transcriptional regulator n=1 Tax=Haliangium sp. TaxID=2663208 RepID=UPI003D0D608B
MSAKPAAHIPLTERKRADIVAAAVALFCEEGFASVSMDRIAQRAGVSKRTVYNHFESKEFLFRECVSVLLQSADAEVKLGDDPEAPVAERLRAFGHRKLAITLRPETMTAMRALMGELIRDPALGQRLFQTGPFSTGTALVELLRTESARGRLALGEADLELASLQFMELIKGPLFWPWLMGLREAPGRAERERVVDDAVTMFMARYGPRP